MTSRRKPPRNRTTGRAGAAATATPESVPARVAAAGSWDRALLIAALAAIVLLFTCGAFRCIWGADFWWQYRTGRLVAESGPPSVDTLSYTVPGHPWIETRWLYCWILYKVISLAGFPAAVLWKWALWAAAYALVTVVAVTRRTAIPACAVLLVAILASSQRLFVRPEMAMSAPASASAVAIVRPRPRAPPVTSATLPSRRNESRTGV